MEAAGKADDTVAVAARTDLLDEFAVAVLVPLGDAIRACLGDGEAMTKNIGAITAHVAALRGSVTDVCAAGVARAQAFLQSRVLAPVATDATATKCARFPALIAALEDHVGAWLREHEQSVRAALERHVLGGGALPPPKQCAYTKQARRGRGRGGGRGFLSGSSARGGGGGLAGPGRTTSSVRFMKFGFLVSKKIST